MRVNLKAPSIEDADLFLSKVKKSKATLAPWVFPPENKSDYTRYIERTKKENMASFFIWSTVNNELLGVINLSEITQGSFKSAYMGYYLFSDHMGKGYMTEAIEQLKTQAFDSLGLHRLEINVQPGNVGSISLARRCGFRYEGYSPRYLNIQGKWRDHLRYAITAEDKPTQKKHTIHPMSAADIKPLSEAFAAEGITKPVSLFERYLQAQAEGKKHIWVAHEGDKPIGYGTLAWHSLYPPFAEQKIPEIKDLSVLPSHRGKGVATDFIDLAEKTAAARSEIIGIGVGLHQGYGAAQRLYCALGYLPDKKGISFVYQTVCPGKIIRVDDEFCLWFTKRNPYAPMIET